MNTINLEDLFTEGREKDGVWFEPRIKGVPCGIQFLVTGRSTDENVAGGERYDKALAALEEVKDPIEKARKQKELFANRVAEFVKGIRPAKDSEVMYNGKPLEFSVPMIQKLLQEAPLITGQIFSFVTDTANFMKGENNA